ncbi:SgcJ/EcaC family oxidoreductase [Erythrobacter sp. SG61-1L]|uniref:SgcJ/EcaC family oxidoreductase n=1 Tax=Erythrobacter sp. SG61-1L TaxID=1603897 RepID=UPI0006C8FA83|nr:SgcJ/EcaC family oxidoreductase [Erythrobacter sp. SG61-1L]
MIRAAVILCAALSLASCQVAKEPEAAEIEKQAVVAALAESTAGWNSGNLDRFIGVYSEDPQASYVTAEGLVRGRKALADRYSTKYDFSNPATRGALSLETLDFRLLDPQHALYIGRYTLAYPDGKTASGPTSLVLQKEAGGWKIIADHSS